MLVDEQSVTRGCKVIVLNNRGKFEVFTVEDLYRDRKNQWVLKILDVSGQYFKVPLSEAELFSKGGAGA